MSSQNSFSNPSSLFLPSSPPSSLAPSLRPSPPPSLRLSLIHILVTGKADLEDAEAEERARLVGVAAEQRSSLYVGLNQIEALNTLIDTRVWREQRQALFRTPQQIRGSLLVRLGIPPSPLVSFGAVQGVYGSGRSGKGATPLMGQGKPMQLPTRSPAVISGRYQSFPPIHHHHHHHHHHPYSRICTTTLFKKLKFTLLPSNIYTHVLP